MTAEVVAILGVGAGLLAVLVPLFWPCEATIYTGWKHGSTAVSTQ